MNQSNGWRTIKEAVARWAAEDGDQRAAAFAYYLLLSMMPMALLLVAAVSLFVEREAATQAIIELVNHYTPLTSGQESKAVASIHEWLQARGRISLTALPLLIWGAIKYLRTLIRTTNRLWRAETYNWWRLPLKSLGLLGITASAVLLGILLPMLTGLAGQWITAYLEFPPWAFSLIFSLIPGIILFYGLIMIYRLASFDALYGALGSIVAFLLWLYLSSSVGVFGICLCAAHVPPVNSNSTRTSP